MGTIVVNIEAPISGIWRFLGFGVYDLGIRGPGFGVRGFGLGLGDWRLRVKRLRV